VIECGGDNAHIRSEWRAATQWWK